jgi:uncharacterized protein (DUF1499 family)
MRKYLPILIALVLLGIGGYLVVMKKKANSMGIVENRVKSTYFQFSDNIEFGLENKKYSVGIRFTHLSNLGIKKPNPSVDFYQLS